MVNFSRIVCALAITGLVSSQTLASTKASASTRTAPSGIAKGSGRPSAPTGSPSAAPSGVAAPSGAVPSGQRGAASQAASDSLPPLSLLGSKREAQQTAPAQVKTSVGPPLSGPIPTGTAIPSGPPPSDKPSATRRATGIGRRQQSSASSSAARASGSPPPKPSGARPSGPPPSGVPSNAPTNGVAELKFSKLPPGFDSTSSDSSSRPTASSKPRRA